MKKFTRVGLCTLVLLVACAGALWENRQTPPLPPATEFDLPAPRALHSPRTLWATWYWTPTYTSQPDGIPLLDAQEKPLGPRLARESYCTAAVEGALRIGGQMYKFGTYGRRKLTDCTPYWPTMGQAPYVRFVKSSSSYGEGVNGYDLVPYRSIAVDGDRIPIGTVLYIPSARGNLVTLPDGRRVRHDGYFFAADAGLSIDGDHIDVFLGVTRVSPFPWVVSRPGGTFTAYPIDDPAIKDRMRRSHLPLGVKPTPGR